MIPKLWTDPQPTRFVGSDYGSEYNLFPPYAGGDFTTPMQVLPQVGNTVRRNVILRAVTGSVWLLDSPDPVHVRTIGGVIIVQNGFELATAIVGFELQTCAPIWAVCNIPGDLVTLNVAVTNYHVEGC